MKGDIKSRAFEVELYPDTETYDCYSVLKYIRLKYDYVFSFHDKDTYETDTDDHKKGDLKKAHYHVIIRWAGCPRYASGLSKELGVPERFFLPIHGDEKSRTCLKYRLRYQIHLNELEKYQYPVSNVKGSGKLKELFLLYVNAERNGSLEENNKAICNYIKSCKYISTMDLFLYCIDNGLYWDYKKNCSTYHRILDEHNYFYNYKDLD